MNRGQKDLFVEFRTAITEMRNISCISDHHNQQSRTESALVIGVITRINGVPWLPVQVPRMLIALWNCQYNQARGKKSDWVSIHCNPLHLSDPMDCNHLSHGVTGEEVWGEGRDADQMPQRLDSVAMWPLAVGRLWLFCLQVTWEANIGLNSGELLSNIDRNCNYHSVVYFLL